MWTTKNVLPTVNAKDNTIINQIRYYIKNPNAYRYIIGDRGTKPTYKFMMINPLLAIELKATPKYNPTNDFHWRQKSSSWPINHLCRRNPYCLTAKF